MDTTVKGLNKWANAHSTFWFDAIRIILGIFLICYLLIAFLLRFVDSGSFVLLELMWFCNLALFEAGYGMLTDRPLLVAASLVTVLTDQLCW